MLWREVGERLERGAWRGPAVTLATRVWAGVAARTLARPLRWGARTRVITVGGSTLGGSGKTPLALACARELAKAGQRVALVGHAYRARPGQARWVRAEDGVDVVGDEALACARALAGVPGVRVVVGPTRQHAVDLVDGAVDAIVLDGPVQLRPRRADLALLAVDARTPWGSAACPPGGDLRAPVDALLDATDRVVTIGQEGDARVVSRGAHVDGVLRTWDELRPLRLGLHSSVARPGRLRDTLAESSITPVATLAAGDHAGPSSAMRRRAERLAGDVDLWLCTAKCAAHLGTKLGGRPLAVLDHALALPRALIAHLLATPPTCPSP